jgi:hypothetical protein
MNNEAKHTPGPWTVTVVGNGYSVVHDHERGGIGEPLAQRIKSVYDARLIADAPKLLDALRVCLGHLTGGMDGDWRDCDPAELARAAIANAERS